MTESLLNLTLSLAQKEGAKEVIVQHSFGPGYQIRFSNSAIDIAKKWDNNTLEVFLAIGRKTTQIDILDPSPTKIREAIPRTMRFLRKMPDSELYAGMEDRVLAYQQLDGLYDKRVEGLYEQAPDLVNGAINAALAAGAKRVAGVLYFGSETVELQTSYGFTGSYQHSYYRSTIRSFVDFESSGQQVVVGRNLTDLEKKLTNAGQKAGELAAMAVGGRQGKAGTYDLIMSPTVGANVLGEITNSANPLMILMEMSPLKDHFGEQIAPENLQVIDDPHISEGLESKPFDVEGTPTTKTPIIQNGVLVGMIHNTSSAKIMQTESTGNSALLDIGMGSKILAPETTNMVFSKGEQTFEEIVADSRKPTIYVTSNWYTRFTNMLEGEFSTIPRDAMFLIEKGEIKKPVRKLRLTDNLLRMSKNIIAVGKDQKQIFWWEVYTPTFISTIKVADCRLTTATQ